MLVLWKTLKSTIVAERDAKWYCLYSIDRAILGAIRVSLRISLRMTQIEFLFSERNILPLHQDNPSRRGARHFNWSGSILYAIIVVALGVSSNLFAQNEGDRPVTGEGARWYGTTGKTLPFDTAARKEITERALESAGLLEGAIDPTTYYVGPNDALTVTIWTSKTQQYNFLVTPDAKGLIETVGEVDLRGKTLAEAEVEIKKAVARVYNVNASVSLRKMREFKVNVIGAVRFPGAVTATPTTRVSEVINLAGGTLQRGNKRDVLIYREGVAQTQQTIDVDLLPYYAFADKSSNPFVLDGDIIKVNIVDPNSVVQVHGEVAEPGEFPFQPSDSISTIIKSFVWRHSKCLSRFN